MHMKYLRMKELEQFFMLVMPAFYWCLDAGLGLRLGIILLTSSTLNGYFKLALHTPRPYWVNPSVKAYVFEPSFGMPSGHSQNSASLWGRMAAAASRRWLRTALIILVSLIGISRLYLGVHFLSDVLSGWAIGGIILWAFLKLEQPAAAWVEKQTVRKQISLAFLLSLAVIAIFLLIVAALGSWDLPLTWIENASLADSAEPLTPLSVDGIFSGAGTLFGLLAGAAWLWHSGGYAAGGSGLKIVGRYILGAAGVGILLFGLDQVFPEGVSLAALSLRYLRYALVGGWISAGAPFLFMRLGWAGQPARLSEIAI